VLAVLAAVTWGAIARADTPYELKLPRGFPDPDIPADNPLTWEKIELGRFLFYDTRLSGNQTYACASCHQQNKAFTDGLPQAVGSTGELHPRSAMTLTNIAYAATLAWANPTLLTLENQALVPMFNEDPVELGLAGKDAELLDRLRADPRYQRMFAEAFADQADPFSLASITRAIASFERTLISGNSPYDRFVFGVDDNAISDAAKRGEVLFFDETHECFHCHAGFNLTTSVDQAGQVAQRPFHNTALYNVRCSDFGLPELDLPWCDSPPDPALCMLQTAAQPLGCHCQGSGLQDYGCYPPPNTGTYDITHDAQDMGRFKAPTLRNVAATAPYMHDGSIATLEDVLDHYAAGGRTISDGPYAGVGSGSPSKGAFVRGFQLSATDKADLVEFLTSLTDQDFMTNPHFADPFQPVTCPGDCNLDGAVDVSELVTSINVSLGTSSLALCVVSDPSGDGRVTIDELVRAIGSTLNGCR
jgi:cytochrome c peroxidase